MSRALLMLKTVPRLGLGNVLRVAAYRAALKNPLSKIRRLTDNPPAPAKGPFFNMRSKLSKDERYELSIPPLFGFHELPRFNEVPNWFENQTTGKVVLSASQSFYKISDFDANVGDIKLIWELSRFNWLIDFARRAISTGSQAEPYRQVLESWLADWVETNPPYQGSNWKCGQETSLRVIHLLMTAYLLGDDKKPQVGLVSLILQHLMRIEPTRSYAIAQDNNHGTSEAAALFVGGLWLDSLGDKRGQKWAKQGRALLENRAKRLIMEDGCFSQYSVNYHRMMLDTLSYAQWWCERLNAPAFSKGFHHKAKLAADWLYRMIEPTSGDVPNLGANDGAHILNLSNADYRDYRPSVAMAFAVFKSEAMFAHVSVVQSQLLAFGLSPNKRFSELHKNTGGQEGGFAVLERDNFRLFFRYPRFQFRPVQSDLLHVDLWWKGRNVLKDGGTFSYNSTAEDLNYFGGVASHNTVQFGQRDQMPRLGRFLFGAWPKTLDWAASNTFVQAGYKDQKDNYHKRRVHMGDEGVSVTDELRAKGETATLRWRFDPEFIEHMPALQTGEITELNLSIGGLEMTINCDHAFTAQWVEGFQSRYYFHKSTLPVLELTLKTVQQAQWITQIRESR